MKIDLIQIIHLGITLGLVPIANMWIENKISKNNDKLDIKFSSKECTSTLEKKIDDLRNDFKELNKWLRDNWRK